MSSRKHVWLSCDGKACEATFGLPNGEGGPATQGPFETVAEARRHARAARWHTVEGDARDYCPACAQARVARYHLERIGRRHFGSVSKRPTKRVLSQNRTLL